MCRGVLVTSQFPFHELDEEAKRQGRGRGAGKLRRWRYTCTLPFLQTKGSEE